MKLNIKNGKNDTKRSRKIEEKSNYKIVYDYEILEEADELNSLFSDEAETILAICEQLIDKKRIKQNKIKMLEKDNIYFNNSL